MASLSSLQLDAFEAVARHAHFSRAARELGLTQSALSQRILNLEQELGISLFARGPRGVSLTEPGSRLLRYCQQRAQLESELRQKKTEGLSGEIRVAGFSTVMRSLVMPALTPLLLRHPGLRVELMTREVRELADILRRGQAEFVLSDREIPLPGARMTELGVEEYVAIERARGEIPREDYLDNDAEDTITERFFRKSGRDTEATRSFLDEIYAIIDGVALGWGRAVVPAHLIRGRTDVRVLKSRSTLKTSVILHDFPPRYPIPAHEAVIEALRLGITKILVDNN